MADENGVWRTISGRRVFIRDGQSLTDAMRESGKFDSSSDKKNKESEEVAKKIEAPPIKETNLTRLEQGKKLREKYKDFDLEAAVRDAAINNYDLISDYLNDPEEWGEKTCFIRGQFFKAGFYGDTPEYVRAIRYGDVPESGRSLNWATHEYEQGVSVVKIVREGESFSDNSIYAATEGDIQGKVLYEVNGWFLGRTGSDGEPLLIGAKLVREIKKRK